MKQALLLKLFVMIWQRLYFRFILLTQQSHKLSTQDVSLDYLKKSSTLWTYPLNFMGTRCQDMKIKRFKHLNPTLQRIKAYYFGHRIAMSSNHANVLPQNLPMQSNTSSPIY